MTRKLVTARACGGMAVPVSQQKKKINSSFILKHKLLSSSTSLSKPP